MQNSDQPIVFEQLGIVRLKVKQTMESLTLREKQKVDPFNQGFDHKNKSRGINLHQIRLCFQVRSFLANIRYNASNFKDYSIKKLIYQTKFLFIFRFTWAQENRVSWY